ncbi:hypothetical protein BGZ47_008221 [Haplosporangium gracile]|nr:hypothetical protein BGZ47_008221 [Haplosporangium gracile]
MRLITLLGACALVTLSTVRAQDAAAAPAAAGNNLVISAEGVKRDIDPSVYPPLKGLEQRISSYNVYVSKKDAVDKKVAPALATAEKKKEEEKNAAPAEKKDGKKKEKKPPAEKKDEKEAEMKANSKEKKIQQKAFKAADADKKHAKKVLASAHHSDEKEHHHQEKKEQQHREEKKVQVHSHLQDQKFQALNNGGHHHHHHHGYNSHHHHHHGYHKKHGYKKRPPQEARDIHVHTGGEGAAFPSSEPSIIANDSLHDGILDDNNNDDDEEDHDDSSAVEPANEGGGSVGDSSAIGNPYPLSGDNISSDAIPFNHGNLVPSELIDAPDLAGNSDASDASDEDSYYDDEDDVDGDVIVGHGHGAGTKQQDEYHRRDQYQQRQQQQGHAGERYQFLRRH